MIMFLIDYWNLVIDYFFSLCGCQKCFENRSSQKVFPANYRKRRSRNRQSNFNFYLLQENITKKLDWSHKRKKVVMYFD